MPCRRAVPPLLRSDFNSSQSVEPAHETRGSSGAALSQEVGGGAQEARGGSRASPGPGGGRWSHGARDGSGVALSQEAGAEATRHVVAPELS
jgi:hypothetical protein